ncbi:MAG: glycosyl hydrolase [Candidatus Eremiobacteraeota bacterium]|nr:glycosyl hydrolase [Candidatus Eremiobacteraeota bacterium]
MKQIIAGLLMLVLSAFSGAARADDAAAQSLMSKLQWRSVGPFIGGRVVAVAGVAQNRNLFYMGAVDGGIWKSTDYGIRWENISDGKIAPGADSIGAIAVAPSDPNVIYAGTGESDPRGTMVTGGGMYKSRDAGKTWKYTGLRDTHTISSIAVDPRNSRVAYVSSLGHVFADNEARGVFKTTDGGATWSKVLYVDDKTGAATVVLDVKHPNVLYATMWQMYRKPWQLSSGGPGSGLYKSTDSGAHWAKISSNPGFARGLLGKMGVAVSATDPDVVYAIVQAHEGGVFRSGNGGTTWTRVNSEMKLRQRAFYYLTIYVDPQNANVLYAPNVDGCWISRDGGHGWHALRPPHGDNHIVWVNPHDSNILLEGNDGGATVSTDGGKTWSDEHNQPTGQFYHIATDGQFPFHIYGAQQDEGSIEGPSAAEGGGIGGDRWRNVAYGESTFVAPQPDDPNYTYGSGYFSIFLRYDEKTAQYQSISAWPNYQEGAASKDLKYRFAWTHPVLFSASNPRELLVGAQYVLDSMDYGETWREISPDLTRNDPLTEGPTGGPIELDQTSAEVYPYVSALAASPLDPNLIWAGSSDGLVHVTMDHGANWKAITPPTLPQYAEISSIEPSYSSKSSAYLTAQRYMWDDFHPYVFRTTDYGNHWTPITAGVPDDQYVYVVRQDPKQPNLLFLGTGTTVHVSFNDGATWQPLSLNLPGVQVRDIALDSRQGDVAIATHGRAFWILDNLTLLEQFAKSPRLDASQAQVFAPQTAWLTHKYGGGGFPRPNIGSDPPFGATVFFNVPRNYSGSTRATLTFSDAQGHTIRTFALHAKTKSDRLTPEMRETMTPAQIRAAQDREATAISPGMNAFQWDLRYPDATEVTGFYVPSAAGGEDDFPVGPEVIPGSYNVALKYGGGSVVQQTFTVALDPNLHPAPNGLTDRFALQTQIHDTLDAMDQTLNAAIVARDRMPSGQRKTDLGQAIDKLVNLETHSSEGPLSTGTRTRDRLAYLQSDLDFAYDKPTAAQYAVFGELRADAVTGEERLRSLMHG